jgi:hypothetical protein
MHLPCEPPPTFTGRHNPFAAPVSVIAHELHDAEQADSQQMLLTQFPIEHWLLPVHALPFPSLGTHVPLTQ